MNAVHNSRLALLAAALLTLGAGPESTPSPFAPPPVDGVLLRVLAINDFHGHLEPSRLNLDAANGPMAAGGAAALARALAEQREPVDHHVFVAAGDLIGASPLISALAQDEPTVEILDELGLAFSSLGNHEFDEGWAELLRLQDGCTDCERPFAGARFRWLAANVFRADGQLLVPASSVVEYGGVPVGFVGAVTVETPDITAAGATEGLRFVDEAEAVNAEVERLLARGVRAIVLLIHEGGRRTQPRVDGCDGLRGRIDSVVARLHPEVDAVVSGHTHALYECELHGRPVTSALSYGQVLTQLDLQLDPSTGDVAGHRVTTRIIDARQADAAVAARVDAYAAEVAAIAEQELGSCEDLRRVPDPAGTSPLGRVIADAMLAGAPGADLALHNAGGIRADLAGPITYADAHRVLPFGNTIVSVELTGRQVLALLEEQWTRAKGDAALQLAGGSYAWDPEAPPGQRVLADSVRVGGEPLGVGRIYRVATNSYLADGGDGYRVFPQGRNRIDGASLLDAFAAYARAHSPLVAPPPTRVTHGSRPKPLEPEADEEAPTEAPASEPSTD